MNILFTPFHPCWRLRPKGGTRLPALIDRQTACQETQLQNQSWVFPEQLDSQRTRESWTLLLGGTLMQDL